MRKTTFTRIASYLMVLAMVFSLTAAFAVGVSAEGTAQAQWGTDAANLTNEGTLQEALNAAAGDASITYIKLLSDVPLGSSYVTATGGKFTLDLNGKTVTSTIYPFYVKNAVDITITDTSAEQTGKIESTGSGAAAIATLDNSAINLTIAGGAFVGTTAIHTTHPTGGTTAINLTITGGTLQPPGRGHISWGSTGVLDLSGYGKYLDGVNIFNSTGSTITLPSEKIILPEGFDIYQNDEKVTEMLYAYYYTVNGTYVEPETIPEETTSEPEETTPEPEETTPEPEETTPEPEETTPEPEETTSEPEETTSEPEETTPEPEETTPEPEETTPEPEETTPEPEETTSEPEETTSEPEETTSEPEETTSEPEETSSEEPAPEDPIPEEPTVEAQWGADADQPNSGTLQEALEAAADDSSITYIKVMNETTLESSLVANGGEFTLDLNGKKITYAGYVVNVYNSTIITITDTSAEQTGAIISTDDGASAICAYVDSSAQITVLSGELQGGYDAISLSSNASLSASTLTVKGGKLIGGQYAIAASGASVTVTGGTLVGKNADVFWKGGTLDLSNYANAANVTIANYTSADVTLPSENIKLPANYSFYDENDSRVDDVLASDSAYTIDVTKYQVTVNVNDNGSATTSAGDAWVAPGSEVTVNVVPNDGYRISEILINGTPLVGTTFTMPEGDVIIDLTFRLYQAEWGTDKDTLTAWGTLEEAFDAAAADASIAYVKVMNNFDIGNDPYFVEGGKFTLDLNGKTVTSAGHVLYLKNAVDITITDNSAEQTGKIESTTLDEVILVHDTSAINLTIEGGTLSSAGRVIVAHSAFGKVLTVNLTIKGGTLKTAINEHIWWGSTGVLDLSDYAKPTGITVNNFVGAEPKITLPAGYSFYDENGNRVDGVFANNSIYTVNVAKYTVTVNETTNGTVTADQSGNLTPGTVVTLTLIPNEGYKADVTVDGATFDPETNTFVVESSDVTVDVTFRPYQAEWGTDKDTLTEWGILQEAFDAAADENSTVGYIKVVSNMNSASLSATGGSFTLDLGGKTVSSSVYTLVLKNSVNITIADSGEGGKLESIQSGYSAIRMGDNSAVVLTVTGGTIQATGNAIQLSDLISAQVNASLTVTGGTIIADTAILTNGSSVTIAGGDLQGSVQDILWYTGTLDFSGITGSQSITFFCQSTAQAIKLPESGYSLYEEHSGERVTVLSYSTTYVLDVTKYALDYSVDGATVTFAPEERYVLSETPVSFTVEPDALYELSSVTGKTASGADFEISYDEETDTYSFVMPEDDVTVTVKAKYAPFVWGNTSDAMTSTGDFFDLVAAINAGEAPYAKLLADYEVELSESNVDVSGKSFIDLNGHLLEFYAPNGSKVVLGEGADITLFVEQKVDDVNTYDYDVRGAFELQSGSKLTVSGAHLIGYIFYNGGTLDISDAHLATYCELYNLTDAEITIADVVTFAAPFRAFDPAWYNDPNYEGYTVPTVTTLAARVENIASAYIEAVFTVAFDFGEGSGTMPTVEVSSGDFGRDIPTPEGLSHPEGLTLIGWIYEGKDYDSIFANSFYAPELADITLTAKWGAPLYVGGVGMNDGDYLASGATETTDKRPTTGGYAYYKDGVLTLNNYQFTGEGFAYEYDGYYDEKYFALIYSATDLVIELVGSSNLVGTAIFYDEDHDYYFNADTDGIRINGDLTVRGKGSLNIKVEDDGFYIEDLIFESGTVTIGSNDEAIESDSITVLDGALITVSEDGVDSKNVTVKGGEFYLLPEDGDNDVELDTQTLTVTGGKLVVKGYHGIYADYVTVSGGVVEVEAEYGAITPWDTEKEDGFVTISGGKVTLYSVYSDAIYSTGDITVSGGEVTLYCDRGIYADGNVTVTGGELEIEAYGDAIYAAGNVTISGGDIYIYSYSYNGISAYGNITISGGDVVISVGSNYTIEACGDETAVTINGGSIHLMGHILANETTTVTFGGKATRIFIEGDIISTIPPVFTEGEIKHIFTVDGTSYYEGVEISHNWTDAYQADETHHYHICVDEDCVVRYFYLPESYYQYFEDANYGEHTVPEGEAACSVCGYGAEVPDEEIPEDAVLLVGDHYLKIGEYLTFDSDGNPIVVTEKPATGGYLYATVDTVEGFSIVAIVLSNFSFEYTGVAAIIALPNYAYIMQLEGENTITAHADNNYDVLYSGALTNGAGIAAVGSQVVIAGEGSLTVNAEVGVFGFDSSFAVQNGATVTINAQQDGIEIQNGIFAVADATLTVNAGDDGIYISDGRVILAAASRVFVTADDDGFALSYADFLATNATVTVVAMDDAIDADECYIEWENSTFDLTADDHGITVYADSEEGYPFSVMNSILNIEAGDDGIRIYGYPEVLFAGSILNITAEDAGLYFDSTRVMFASQLGMILSLNSTPGTSGNVSEVNINAKRNYLCDTSVDVYEVKLNVVVTETAFALDSASLYFVGSEVSIVSRDMGIYSEYGADVNVYDSTLSIEAARYGINGYLYLDIRGEMVDISVRAFEAIHCDSISLDEDYDYMMNAIFSDFTFMDENDDIASYVTIRSYAVVNVEMEKALEKLDELLSENGEFDAIAGEIANVNNLLDTLTNAEGEGRLDLIEKANEAINAALATLDQNLANAQTNLQNAIDTKADAATVNQSIADLNKALDEAEVAYAAADKALDDKLVAAQTTLDTAIQAVDKKVDDAKTALEAAIAAGDAALTTEVENLSKALNDAEAAYAAADKALDDKLVAAQTTLDTAIQAVDKKVDDAKTALEAAIAAGDATLATEVENLNKALDEAEAAYAAADKALDDKLVAAQTTLDTAIQAVDKKVDDAKTALEAAIAAGDATLTTEVENLNKALDEAEAAYAAADKVISDELTAAKTTLTNVQTRLDTAEATINDLQTAVETLKSLINANTGEVDLSEIATQINTINSKMESLDELGLVAFKSSVTETIATLNASVSALNTTVAGIDKEQISSNKQAVEELNASLAEMKTELETLDTLTAKDVELEGEVNAISGNISTITNKLDDVDGKLATLDGKLAELEKIATGDHGTIDKIQQALADVNKALEDLQGIEDHTRLEALEGAATRVDSTLKTIGEKLDTIDPADITENKSAIESLGSSIEALQATVNSLGTNNGTITESVQAMNTSLDTLSGKVSAAEARFAANESAINALQSAVAALEQANAANASLKAELDALKTEVEEEANGKPSGGQVATTVMATTSVVCNAGLIAALIYIESKKKILLPAIKGGFTSLISKFKKP